MRTAVTIFKNNVAITKLDNYSSLAGYERANILIKNEDTYGLDWGISFGTKRFDKGNVSQVINVNNNIALDIAGGSLAMGDLTDNYNQTKISLSDGLRLIELGNVAGGQNGSKISVDDTFQVVTLTANNGVYLPLATIKCPIKMNLNDATLVSNSTYGQTFNGTTLTATLPTVDGTNVGIQFLITNTNGGNLTVASSSSQPIYSSTGSPSDTTKTLNTGHSQIFTAIFTTSDSNYGWSMV